MTIQTQTNTANLREFVLALPIAEPVQADSRDYGFDFDEAELAEELTAPLPASLSIQSILEVDANEFEKSFHFFLS